MNRRRILLSLGALGTAAAMLPLFAAFEAHVINVTAKIENALAVTTDAIDFGTVFPQEHLEKPLVVALSQSFLDEDRVDDVEYFIRQKPKCAITNEGGTEMLDDRTATGHISLGADDTVVIDCGDPPRPLVNDEVWGVLPSLCEYISKEGEDLNDETLPSFHEPWTIVDHQLVWNDTKGRLAKSEQDRVDNWIIDLAVPCFGGHCAQDWETFVETINPNALPADQWVQPIENEHKIFGCDLWVEVSEVSETPTTTPPEDGTITVTKVVDTVDGSPAAFDEGDFDLFVGVEPVDSGFSEIFVVGSYTISEAEGASFPGGAYTTDIDCDDDDFDGVDSVTLEPGENISCTITNTETDA